MIGPDCDNRFRLLAPLAEAAVPCFARPAPRKWPFLWCLLGFVALLFGFLSYSERALGLYAFHYCESPGGYNSDYDILDGVYLAPGWYGASWSATIDFPENTGGSSVSGCWGTYPVADGSTNFYWGGGYCGVSASCSARYCDSYYCYAANVWFSSSVWALNSAPWANDSYYTIDEDTGTGWVGLNVGDADGNLSDCPTGSSSLPGSFGRSGCSFWFTPSANWNGVAWFDYYAVDSYGATSAWRRAYITVNSVNDAPWANDSYYTINEDTGTGWVGLTVGDVDGNLSDCPTGSSSLPGSFGRSGCSFWFTPSANWNGVAWFDYYAIDSNGATSAWRRAYITVNPLNDAPWANDSYYTINEDTGTGWVGLTVGDVDGNLSDCPTGSSSLPGSFGRSGCSFWFTPSANWNGVAWFDYYAIDSNGATSAWRRAYITVNAVNDAPVSYVGSFSTNEDTPYSGTLSCSDVDSGVLTRSIIAQPANGSVSITNATSGAFTFTPTADWNGATSFTYKCNDGALDSGVASISITVIPVNDPPTLGPISNVTVNSYQGSFAVPLSGIGNGAANEVQTLTVTATTSNTALVLHPLVSYTSPAATGTLTVSPVHGGIGTATITVTVSDGVASTNRTFNVTTFFVYLLHQ